MFQDVLTQLGKLVVDGMTNGAKPPNYSKFCDKYADTIRRHSAHEEYLPVLFN